MSDRSETKPPADEGRLDPRVVRPAPAFAGLRGFGVTITPDGARKWYAGSDGIKRWASNDQPCEAPRCDECQYCWPHEELDEEDYVWAKHCNLALAGGKTILKEEGEPHPAWCPLLPHNVRAKLPAAW
jgi:hypothetical protein